MDKLVNNEKDEVNSDEEEKYSDAQENCDENEDLDLNKKEQNLDENSDNEEEQTNDEEPDLDDEALEALFKDKSEEELQALTDQVAALKLEGNDHFKNSDFTDAIKLYTQALNTCPIVHKTDRSVLYANRAAAKINLDRIDDALFDCNKAIDLNPDYMKALIRRAQLHRKRDNLDQCLADYQKILELDPNNGDARRACVELPPQITERNEKLKTEMFGKLKELGNLVLRPFGLSTENFQVVQDSNSGGYSVNFQNNKSPES